MKEFMAGHFPKVTSVSTNLFSDSKGEPSVHGFVQVVDSKCAKRIVEECGAQHWKLDGFPDVKIKRAKAAVDMNRDWALRRAEELVKSHPAHLGRHSTWGADLTRMSAASYGRCACFRAM